MAEVKTTQSRQVESQQEVRKAQTQFDLLSHLTDEFLNFEQDQRLALASYEAEIQQLESQVRGQKLLLSNLGKNKALIEPSMQASILSFERTI